MRAALISALLPGPSTAHIMLDVVTSIFMHGQISRLTKSYACRPHFTVIMNPLMKLCNKKHIGALICCLKEEFTDAHSQLFSALTTTNRKGTKEKVTKTYKFLVMHQDGLLIRVNAEPDNITIPVAVQQLIIWKEGDETEGDRLPGY